MTELSWHQMNGAGMLAKSYDIIAYAYQADIWCEYCIEKLAKRELVRLGDATMWGDCGSAEDLLSAWARALGIDRDQPQDTSEFPSPVFRDQSDDDQSCGQCLQRINDDY